MSQAVGGCWDVMPFLSILLPLSWRKVQPSVKSKVLVIVRIMSEYIVAFSTQIRQCDTVETLTWSCLPSLLCSLTARFTPIIQLSCFDFCITDVLTVSGLVYAYVFCVSFCSVWEWSFCFFFHWGPGLGTLCPNCVKSFLKEWKIRCKHSVFNQTMQYRAPELDSLCYWRYTALVSFLIQSLVQG